MKSLSFVKMALAIMSLASPIISWRHGTEAAYAASVIVAYMATTTLMLVLALEVVVERIVAQLRDNSRD